MCIHNVAICIALEKHSTDHEGMEEELHLSAIAQYNSHFKYNTMETAMQANMAFLYQRLSIIISDTKKLN